MIPIKFGSSDGLFNLGSALAFVQTLPPGIVRSHERPLFSLEQRPEKPADRHVWGDPLTAGPRVRVAFPAPHPAFLPRLRG